MRKKATIMVIEDEELLLDVISKKLIICGLSPISCISGKQALDYLSNLNNLHNLPDAIWLDYYLKDMNGVEFMKLIKEKQNYNSIPVIVVSNSANPEKIHNMLSLGVKKYLVKSEYRLDDIIKIVRDLVLDKTNLN